MMDMMNGGLTAWMLAWTLLVVGVLAFGGGWLVRHGLKSATDHRQSALANPAHDAPLELLRRRYAAGEIDEDEYLIRLSGLSHY